MCTIDKKFGRFAQLLLDGGAGLEENLSYEALCRRLHVAPASLSAYARKELGMDGPEILDCFRLLLNLQANACVKPPF